MTEQADLSYAVIGLLRERHLTIGTAESLTGGLVGAALTDVPGASAVVRGGVTAYATELKARVLGVDATLLRDRGAVDRDVALAMADGARRVLGSDVGVATTGVAGPDPQDGQPVGTVHIAVTGPGTREVRSLLLSGDRHRIRTDTVTESLRLVSQVLRDGAGR